MFIVARNTHLTLSFPGTPALWASEEPPDTAEQCAHAETYASIETAASSITASWLAGISGTTELIACAITHRSLQALGKPAHRVDGVVVATPPRHVAGKLRGPIIERNQPQQAFGEHALARSEPERSTATLFRDALAAPASETLNSAIEGISDIAALLNDAVLLPRDRRRLSTHGHQRRQALNPGRLSRPCVARSIARRLRARLRRCRIGRRVPALGETAAAAFRW